MASYKIEWKPSAERELEKLPREAIQRIIGAINELAKNPFPSGNKKLTGSEQSYRIRIGAYRVIYDINTNRLIVEIIRVKHRKEVYRRL